jgi:uncharacterized protein (TIGR02588 family)
MTERLPRSRAEWVTFATSLVLLGVLILVLLHGSRRTSNALPHVRIVRVTTPEPGLVYAEASVRNDGDRAASNVEIIATLTVGGHEQQGSQIITFLAGRETLTIQFVFATKAGEPKTATSNVAVRVASFVAK